MYYWEHGTEHTETTKLLETVVKSQLEIEKLQTQLM
jgi:hypothetical protein